MATTVRPFVKDGFELDQIAVQGIRVTGYHGVLRTERESGQLFIADVVAHVNARGAAATDHVDRTVNYSNIADAVAEVLAGDAANLLETVAEHCARRVLEMDGVDCVDVTIHKPQAPLHVEFKDVTVHIRRDLRSGTLWADKRIGSSAGAPDDPQSPGGSVRRDMFDERPRQPVTAWIALGGNVGSVEETLRDAVHQLDRVAEVHVVATSALFQTAPVGGPPQPDFLNAVVQIETFLAPRELLAACQGIEVVHGRERSVANGPRNLDIDIVSYAGLVGASGDLTLPHPRAHERAFVLAPMADIDADAVLPGPSGGTAGSLLAAVGASSATVVAKPWPSGAEARVTSTEQGEMPTESGETPDESGETPDADTP